MSLLSSEYHLMRICFFIFLVLSITKIDSYGSQVKQVFQGNLTKIILPHNPQHEALLFEKLETAIISIKDKKAFLHLKDGTPMSFCDACGSVEELRSEFAQRNSLPLVFYKEKDLGWMEFVNNNLSLMEFENAVRSQKILSPDWNSTTRRATYSREKTIPIELQ